MNKLYISIFVALASLFTACSQDKEIAATAGSEKERIELSVSMPTGEDSRLSYTEDGDKTYQFTWEEGDKLVVLAYQDETRKCTTYELDLKAGAGESTGIFSGFVNTRDYQRFLIAYKSKNLQIDTENFDFSLNYPSDFVQDNAAPTKHLKESLFLMSGLVLKKDFGSHISLTMQNVLLRVDIKSVDERIGDVSVVKCIFRNQDSYGRPSTVEKSVSLTHPISASTPASVYLAMPQTPYYEINVQCLGTKQYGNVTRQGNFINQKTLQRGKRYYFSIATSSVEGDLSIWEVKMPSQPILMRFTDMNTPPVLDQYYSPIKEIVDGTEYWSYRPKDLEQTIMLGLWWASPNTLTEIIVPDNISRLHSSVFSQFDKLTTVKGCANVTSIEEQAFYMCSSLTTIPSFNKVTGEIGARAFKECTSLETLSDFAQVTRIGSQAFQDCTKLTTLPEFPHLKEIGANAFTGCYNLEKLPSSFGNVKILESRAFKNCSKLTDIPVFQNVTEFNSALLVGCPHITDISNKFPNVTSLATWNGVYEGWTELRKLPLFEKVTTLSSNAYRNTNFEQDPSVAITVGRQVTRIESDAFGNIWNCTINMLVDPNTCWIDDNMFENILGFSQPNPRNTTLYLNEVWLEQTGKRKPAKTIDAQGKTTYSWFGWPWVNITLVKVNSDNVTFTMSDQQL